MKKEEFEKIITILKDLQKDAKEIYTKITSEDVNDMKIKEVVEYTEKARSLMSKMDQLSKSDVYHIIGMGGLDNKQIIAFAKEFKKLGYYNPYIKALAGYQIQSFPPLPKNVEYCCSVLKVKLKG